MEYVPLEPSQGAKTMELGVIFDRFDGWSGDSVRRTFVMNGLDAAVFLPSKVMKYSIDPFERK